MPSMQTSGKSSEGTFLIMIYMKYRKGELVRRLKVLNVAPELGRSKSGLE